MSSEPAPFGVPIVGNDWSRVPATPPRRVSVVVAHFDQQAELDRTLAALARQTHPRDLLEVIVVDDGSPVAPSVPDGVLLVQQADEGFRLAAARNLGIAASAGDVLCFLDADTVPEPEYVERIASLPSAAPDVVAAGRRRHAALGGLPPDALVERVGPEHELDEPRWLVDAYARSSDLLHADARSYRFAIGAVLACSRWLIDDIGGFDESFRTYGGEDWEWASRAWRGGAALAHVHDAVAWHDGPDWAARDATERIRRKNLETVRLIDAIGGPGATPTSLLSARADVVVRIAEAASVAAAIICADRMLAAFPTARIVVPEPLRGSMPADPRIVAELPEHRARIDLAQCLMLGEGAIRVVREVVATIGDADVASVALGESIVVRAARAEARDRRWGRSTGWRHDRRGLRGVHALAAEPDLERYLGGW